VAAVSALAVLGAASWVCGPAVAAPLPSVLPLAGAVSTPGAGPVADGAYAMTFRLYDGPDAAANLVFQEVVAAVPVSQGTFSWVLGADPAGPKLPFAAFTETPSLWLGVAVGADPELPRRALQPVPFAQRAAHADQANSALTAQSADVALAAQSLQCTGCVAVDMLAEAALQAQNHLAIYSGKPASTQAAITGLDGRLAGLEAGLTAVDPAGNGGLCAVDAGPLCVGGRAAQLVVRVADGVEMAAVAPPLGNGPVDPAGVVVYREDEDIYYGHTKLGWRPFKFGPLCGDGLIEAAEACDDGPANANQPDACRTDCTLPACGDGIVDQGEACDDGNAVDTDACVPGCKAATCGDGFVQAGVEDCDDGNASDEDACLNTCVPNVCGDGKLHQGVEECDDGNLIDGDDCDKSCKLEYVPPAQCNGYGTLNQSWRKVSNNSNGGNCDKFSGWYRFVEPAGTKMPDSAPPKNVCGTDATGWLQGGHPQNPGETVNRKVCFHWGSNTCNWSTNIQVTNCKDFYVYKLNSTPACSLAYCGE
jgi:cysteine-rich repeat protein